MNTPDTEWETKVREAVEHICDLSSFGQPLHPNDIKHYFISLLTSRDTYWKERVRKEIEGMKWVENLNKEIHHEVRAEIVRHNQALDDLLQALVNLK